MEADRRARIDHNNRFDRDRSRFQSTKRKVGVSRQARVILGEGYASDESDPSDDRAANVDDASAADMASDDDENLSNIELSQKYRALVKSVARQKTVTSSQAQPSTIQIVNVKSNFYSLDRVVGCDTVRKLK